MRKRDKEWEKRRREERRNGSENLCIWAVAKKRNVGMRKKKVTVMEKLEKGREGEREKGREGERERKKGIERERGKGEIFGIELMSSSSSDEWIQGTERGEIWNWNQIANRQSKGMCWMGKGGEKEGRKREKKNKIGEKKKEESI